MWSTTHDGLDRSNPPNWNDDGMDRLNPPNRYGVVVLWAACERELNGHIS